MTAAGDDFLDSLGRARYRAVELLGSVAGIDFFSFRGSARYRRLYIERQSRHY